MDNIQRFFSEQGEETLKWWYLKEDEIIDYIETRLSENPYIGTKVKSGCFKVLGKITFGKSKHVMLNYIIYYALHERDGYVDVINILPSRTKRKRVEK
ncbi:hypothetical protein QUF56_06870 [Ureibacillus composti]|nr:hypothetical protein [Ureibacillus composti]